MEERQKEKEVWHRTKYTQEHIPNFELVNEIMMEDTIDKVKNVKLDY